MKLTIDNQDGAGAVDYTAAVSSARPLEIVRKLNAPSVCTFVLAGCGTALPIPARIGRVVVTDALGAYLFTGYLAVEPAMEYAGAGLAGAVYQALVSAVGDEFLLDKQNLPQTNGTWGQTVGAVFRSLTARVATTALTVDPALSAVTFGHFLPEPGLTWSENAGALAAESRAAYRALAGTVSLAPIGSMVHSLSDTNGTLQLTGLTASRAKMVANDVTVCGALEPSAYVTEIFQGDGATAVFDLARLPFFPVASKSKPLQDLFQGPGVNPLLWTLSDPGSNVAITSNGLTVGGGTGNDGDTTVTSIDQIEMGGSVTAETAGVLLGAGSTGIICGFYGDSALLTQCFVGFHVKQAAGATVIGAVVGGADVGGTFTPTPGKLYTLRLRVHCKEAQRVLQAYRSIAGVTALTLGGDQAPALADVQLEIQDVTNGANGTVTVLYGASVPFAPSACAFVPLSSKALVASIRNVKVSQNGSVWVTSQPLGSAVVTRRIGPATTGGECKALRNGKIQFYPGSLPTGGELVTVTYRTSNRSVARLASAASIVAETTLTVPGTSRWAGSVVRPAARSSADCENAALAMLNFSADRNAAWQGQYTAFNLQNGTDVWPGDVLAIASAGLTANLVVRAVRVEIGSGAPETAKYTLEFANDWADNLSMKLNGVVPNDAWVPQQAAAGVVALRSLVGLTVGIVSATTIPVNAGVSAPPGGGFEVRRTDWVFRPGIDPDLVLRSAAPNFDIPREASVEQYFIRMYDGSVPPRYSRFSSAVFLNIGM